MEQYITAGLIGSLVTIIIQAIINAISDRVKHNRELRTMVFQRKLEVVEKAMSWYQETLDMYYKNYFSSKSSVNCMSRKLSRKHRL